MKLFKYEVIVKNLLESDKKCRCDDMYLFARVIEVLTGERLNRVSLLNALKHRTRYGIPSFSTIMRCRQKIQSENDSLCDAGIKEKRRIAEQEFREYYRSNSNGK